MRLASALLTVTLLAACSDTPFGPDEFREAALAKARWEARGFVDYDFEYRSACFCPPQLTEWARVAVRNGQVFSVQMVGSKALIDPQYFPMWPTVDALFEQIFRNHGSDSFLLDIIAQFDRQLGYPTSVTFIFDPGIQDAGGTHYLRNLIPMP